MSTTWQTCRRAAGFSALLAAVIALSSAIPAAAATLTVTSSADSGAGSLRDAVGAAANGDVVQIAAGVNPVLTSGEIVVNNSVTIRGQSATATTVGAGGRSRIFRIAGGSVSIEDLALTGGRAGDGAGGGQGLGGAPGGDGGAILNEATLTVSRAIIVNSSAGNGGTGGDGFLLVGPGPGGDGGRGGGIANFGTLRLEASTIASNRAGTGGASGSGGLGDPPAGGDGGGGGAIFTDGGAGRSTLLINVTITGNTAGNGTSGGAAGRGGGVLTAGGGGDGSITIRHATITANSAGSGTDRAGGGLASSSGAGVLVVQNSILAANNAPSGANCAGGAIGDGANNVAFPAGGCPSTFSNADPNLDPNGTRDNGGPTPTIAIRGAGSAMNQVPAGQNCAPLDQRGIARPQGAACDVGAFEHRAPICRDVEVQTRPGRTVKVSLSCAGPGSAKYATKSNPGNGKLRKLKPSAGTVEYQANRRFRGTDTFTYTGTNLVGESAPAKVTVTVSGPLPPPNKFRFGKVSLNRNKGTAKLRVKVPGPGKLKVSGKPVKNVSRKAKKKGTVKLPVKPSKKTRRKLKRRGVVTVRATVRYTPRGGFTRKRTKKIRLRTNSFFVPLF